MDSSVPSTSGILSILQSFPYQWRQPSYPWDIPECVEYQSVKGLILIRCSRSQAWDKYPPHLCDLFPRALILIFGRGRCIFIVMECAVCFCTVSVCSNQWRSPLRRRRKKIRDLLVWWVSYSRLPLGYTCTCTYVLYACCRGKLNGA